MLSSSRVLSVDSAVNARHTFFSVRSFVVVVVVGGCQILCSSSAIFARSPKTIKPWIQLERAMLDQRNNHVWWYRIMYIYRTRWNKTMLCTLYEMGFLAANRNTNLWFVGRFFDKRARRYHWTMFDIGTSFLKCKLINFRSFTQIVTISNAVRNLFCSCALHSMDFKWEWMNLE